MDGSTIMTESNSRFFIRFSMDEVGSEILALTEPKQFSVTTDFDLGLPKNRKYLIYGQSFTPVPIHPNSKLGWVELTHTMFFSKKGIPLQSPTLVLSRFNILRELGWQIRDAEFREKYLKPQFIKKI